MLTRVVSVFALAGATALSSVSTLATPGGRPAQNFTVHEWGTFTTVAGRDGRAIDWLPLGGPADLPCFVEHFKGPNATLQSNAQTNGQGNVQYKTVLFY